ncbi:ABC transporter substrate-binding protein [Novosphingobium album (ex Hu et al. 2023)]|uniref:ABC transporter substrate-binding protein n=1 Tax=Novosphingobium album (ex Hu et al. 2023) TaxID=2930093 RepID=A0ABT0B7Q4_9SPHN|nr:ABC transporter substrate-binding protein [Novosphingobium album (ex Hu et al. 2023)]MCJ2180915.1 ABC transporter substrate-binding protein [Novosphingobium album (ex Hu et al. 2023)]
MTEGAPLNRRSLLGAGIAGAGLLALPGCGPSRSGGRPLHGGMIRVATQITSTSDTLDPAKGAMATDYMRHFMLYNGLTCIDDDTMSPKLSLAKELASADRVTWHVDLRRGIRFHDGAELTSADVVYSLMRHKDPAVASKIGTIAKQLAEVTTDGRYGVVIRLVAANADLPTILAQSHFLIIKAGQEKPDGTGTGPFRLVEFSPGVRTIFDKNREYWVPGRPYLERVELFAIPDEVSRVNALLSGDVHAINALSPHSTRRVESNRDCAVVVTPSALYTDLIMRQDALPTGNPDFVQAVKHLLDRQLINRALYRNFGTIANDQPIAPFQPYYNPNVPQTHFDLDKARWHVKRAGLQGVRLPIYASTAANGSVDMASILQEHGAGVGLNFAVNRVPADGYWSTHWMRHPMTFGACNPRPTADLIFSLFYDSKATMNESGWKNDRFDRLLIEARGATDEALRTEIYGEMQQIVHDKCPVAIPVFISLIDAYDRRIKGVRPVPLGGFMGYRFAEYVWWED